jgi:hypothetical protein
MKNKFYRTSTWVLCLAALGCAQSVGPIDEVGIEPDAALEVAPGEGAGVFVEYYSDGFWWVYTTCDTNRSGLACDYDVELFVPKVERFRDAEGDDLEFNDDLFVDKTSIRLRARTNTDFDGFSFYTEPGVKVRLDVHLGGESRPDIVFWNSRGALQHAAPTNPVDFLPEQ